MRPWFDDIASQLIFEQGARRSGMTFVHELVGDPPGLVYRFVIDVPVHDEQRNVKVEFRASRSPSAPVVTIDGPRCLKHRWGDDSLCMWVDTDPPEERWIHSDGLQDLLGHIRGHAFCEAECREGKPWPKPESAGEHPRPKHCPPCAGKP